jgi:hypothetical protein
MKEEADVLEIASHLLSQTYCNPFLFFSFHFIFLVDHEALFHSPLTPPVRRPRACGERQLCKSNALFSTSRGRDKMSRSLMHVSK